MRFLHSPAAVIRNPMFKFYKSLVLSELGRLNIRSDKSEDLLCVANGVGSLKVLIALRAVLIFRTLEPLELF